MKGRWFPCHILFHLFLLHSTLLSSALDLPEITSTTFLVETTIGGEDSCLYDSDCDSPGERICLDKRCQCLRDSYIWDGVQRCQTQEFIESLQKPSTKLSNLSVTIAVGLATAVILVAATIALSVAYCKKRAYYSRPEQKDSLRTHHSPMNSELFNRKDTLATLTEMRRESSLQNVIKQVSGNLVVESADGKWKLGEPSRIVDVKTRDRRASSLVPLHMQMKRPVWSF